MLDYWTLIFILPFGIHGEPAALDALALLKHLEDAPEARAADDTQDGAGNLVGHEERACDEGKASEEEHPPAAHTEVVFAFDDEGMEDTNDEKGGYGGDESDEIHASVASVSCSTKGLVALNRWQR